MAQEAEQGTPAEALVQVADRHPIDVRQLAVHVSGERLESSPDLGILGDTAAAGGRDLHQGDTVEVAGIGPQKMCERFEALHQSLRIVEPVHADDQPAAAEADPKALELPAALCHGGVALDITGVDADRMGLDPEDPPERANDRASLSLLHPGVRLANQIVEKVSAVRLRLEADKVEEGEATHELPVHRQSCQELPWRQGCVQKEA